MKKINIEGLGEFDLNTIVSNSYLDTDILESQKELKKFNFEFLPEKSIYLPEFIKNHLEEKKTMLRDKMEWFGKQKHTKIGEIYYCLKKLKKMEEGINELIEEERKLQKLVFKELKVENELETNK